jgi:NACalpha-BTF3-like transcription factor
MVQTDRLPPEVVSRGYQVVTANGDVLKVVPRELTEAERKARDARAEQQQRLAAERERIRKWDQSLILRYSDVKEIDAAKRRSLKEFDTRIGILQANLLSLKAQIESEQSDAANYLRRGKEVPKELAEHIDSLRSEVLYAENRVDELSRERIETEEQYELDKERFRLIMEQAALQ